MRVNFLGIITAILLRTSSSRFWKKANTTVRRECINKPNNDNACGSLCVYSEYKFFESVHNGNFDETQFYFVSDLLKPIMKRIKFHLFQLSLNNVIKNVHFAIELRSLLIKKKRMPKIGGTLQFKNNGSPF